eukprot:6171594-Pyramimonas_sp.AAC.1
MCSVKSYFVMSGCARMGSFGRDNGWSPIPAGSGWHDSILKISKAKPYGTCSAQGGSGKSRLGREAESISFLNISVREMQ